MHGIELSELIQSGLEDAGLPFHELGWKLVAFEGVNGKVESFMSHVIGNRMCCMDAWDAAVLWAYFSAFRIFYPYIPFPFGLFPCSSSFSYLIAARWPPSSIVPAGYQVCNKVNQNVEKQ